MIGSALLLSLFIIRIFYIQQTHEGEDDDDDPPSSSPNPIRIIKIMNMGVT